MTNTNLIFGLTSSRSQMEMAGVGLPLPSVRKFVLFCAWENVRESQSAPVMGIDCQDDVRVRLPQMVHHGFHAGSLHLISFFLGARGADGTMHQKKGGVFPVDVFGTFVLPPFPDGRGRS